MNARHTLLATVLAMAGTTAQAQSPPTPPDGLSFSGIRPQLSLDDGNFTIAPYLRAGYDAGSYFQQSDANRNRFSSGDNLRWLRMGLTGTVARDFTYTFLWDLQPSVPQEPVRGGRIYQASVAYTGLDWATFRIGAFTIPFTQLAPQSGFEQIFVERPSIVSMAISVAAGDTRLGAGGEIFNARWYAAAYLTQGVLSTLHDNKEEGVTTRGAWLAADDGFLRMQLGVDASYQGHPGSNANEAQSLADYPELRLNRYRYLATGSIPANDAWTLGGELTGTIGRLYYEAEYHSIGVDAVTGGARHFDGWYANLAYPIFGAPRLRNPRTAMWGLGRVPNIDFRQSWGTLELAAGYSMADLNSGPTQGGRQEIWTAGLNYWPTGYLRGTVEYQNGRIAQPGPDRDFQAVDFRLVLQL